MKVTEIVNEGFVSGLWGALKPKAFKALERPGPATSQADALAAAEKLYAPGGEEDWRGSNQPAPAPAPSGSQSVVTPLHPDVQVINPVPAILRYRGRDYEYDDITHSWTPLGSNKKVSPALGAFLTKELSKL